MATLLRDGPRPLFSMQEWGGVSPRVLALLRMLASAIPGTYPGAWLTSAQGRPPRHRLLWILNQIRGGAAPGDWK